jgi:hypothetical protein
MRGDEEKKVDTQEEMTPRSDKEVLESLAQSDEGVEHHDDCGHCGMLIFMAQTARDLLAEKKYSLAFWNEEARRRWQDSKYFKLYQEEKAAGRDPNEAFNERGWEM